MNWSLATPMTWKQFGHMSPGRAHMAKASRATCILRQRRLWGPCGVMDRPPLRPGGRARWCRRSIRERTPTAGHACTSTAGQAGGIRIEKTIVVQLCHHAIRPRTGILPIRHPIADGRQSPGHGNPDVATIFPDQDGHGFWSLGSQRLESTVAPGRPTVVCVARSGDYLCEGVHGRLLGARTAARV